MSAAFQNPRTFLLERPLYAEEAFSGEVTWAVLDLFYFNGTYDSYCTKCKREATFKAHAPERPEQFKRNMELEKLQRAHGIEVTVPRLAQDVYRVRSTCTRESTHAQDFFFLIGYRLEGEEGQKRQLVSFVQKIGQQPSFGDLHLEHVKKYRGSLPSTQLRELTRAISLASHDVGVGAYVYLRRVFEWLVEEARQAACAKPGWDEDSYSRARMGEKIALLREHLPEFLVEHPEMYGLLSKGVHELSEADCLDHFSTLRIATELILDERLEKQLKAKKIAEAKAALAKAAVKNA